MMNWKELSSRFEFHPADAGRAMDHQEVRDMLWAVADYFNNTLLPDGREKSLVMTSLEEAMFWSNAAIARESAENRRARLG